MRITETKPDSEGWVFPNGYYSEITTVSFEGNEYALGSGTSDTVEFYQTDYGVVVLTKNYRMGYLGVDVLDPNWHDKVVCDGLPKDYVITYARPVIFFQYTEPDQIGPKDTLDYTDRTIIRRIMEDYQLD